LSEWPSGEHKEKIEHWMLREFGQSTVGINTKMDYQGPDGNVDTGFKWSHGDKYRLFATYDALRRHTAPDVIAYLDRERVSELMRNNPETPVILWDDNGVLRIQLKRLEDQFDHRF
jgi:hypothetical protein